MKKRRSARVTKRAKPAKLLLRDGEGQQSPGLASYQYTTHLISESWKFYLVVPTVKLTFIYEREDWEIPSTMSFNCQSRTINLIRTAASYPISLPTYTSHFLKPLPLIQVKNVDK